MYSKKMSRREFLKLGGLATGGVILAGCSPAATETPTVEPTKEVVVPKDVTGHIVVMKGGTEWSEEMVAPFLQNNTGITLELLEADTTRFYAMLAAGTPPDLMRIQAPGIPQYLARKILLDLTAYFETSTIVRPDDLAPANNYYKANSPTDIGSGLIYGMCKDWSPDFTMWVNSKIYEDAGVALPSDQTNMTYQEVADQAKQLTKFEGDRTLVFGYGYDAAWIDRMWMNLLGEKNISLYKDSFNKIDLTGNEEAKAVVKWYYDLAKANVVANPLNPSPSWIGDDFNKAILANCQYGFWFGGMAESDLTKGLTTMIPTATWAGVKRDPTMTATGYIITAATKVPDAAWKVFEWYMGGEPADGRATSGWGVPALKSKYTMIPQGTDFEKQKYKVLQGELALETAPLQFNPYLSEGVVPDSWNKNLELSLQGNLTFDELVDAIETEVNAAIVDGIQRIQS